MKLIQSLAQLPDGQAFDVAVIGAGGAGMATALFAALEGREVLLVEHTEYVGGTTALSAGTCWVPGTTQGASVNPNDTLADADRYLQTAVGHYGVSDLRRVFLERGAEAIEHLAKKSEVQFRPYAKHPDYISELAGSTTAGRALEPVPFDARQLGKLFGLVRPPIEEFTVLGGMMVDRTDINHLLGMRQSWASLKHSLRILTRHARDKLSHPRGTRLVMGNALIARLLHSLSSLPNVTLAMNTEVTSLQGDHYGVKGLTLAKSGAFKSVRVRGGVVLASGGFNRNEVRRRALLPGTESGWCPGAPGHTGKAHVLAETVGARYGKETMSPAYWAPVSRRKRADGSTAVFPHFVMDRAKPGVLCVNSAAQRFVNESTSYHLFGLAMQQSGSDGRVSTPAFLICDAIALKKYGLGMVRPGGGGLARFLADGYLTQAETVEELAKSLGIDGQRLTATVARFNQLARSGVDEDFHRGETTYQRNLGDPHWPGPNPCMGPLEQGPYFAVRLYPGDIGAAQGFDTDVHAQTLDENGHPIPGLYAVGNDMRSIMGGVYTAPGITIGPGIVFGYLAARHACARALDMR
ncbi:FAD-dependent oxidoreductase (plasmid) [Diaphorobacter sp. HDW4B]|nr:FAD-dependent oxidoreductase [Diaphorobacter sp. HDW4B]